MEENKEFVPIDHAARVLHFWWFVALLGIVGGLAGLVINRFKPPLYEGQAVFSVNIDFNKIDFANLPAKTPEPYLFTQYDEDLSLAVVQYSLYKVIPQVVTFAQQNGIQVDSQSLLGISSIERDHAFWYVRFRNQNPALTQKIVNYWAQQAYADLQAQAKAGALPNYIIFNLAQLADLPKSPTYFQTNVFVLAGMVIGLVAGIFTVNLPFFRFGKDH